MKRIVVTIAVFTSIVLGAVVLANGEAESKKVDPSFWMKRKLAYSKNVLSGLTEGNFDKISRNAEFMKGLNQIEHFVRRDPKGYQAQLKLFEFSNDELIRSAKKRDLGSATLAYTQVTISCVNCHRILRDSGQWAK